MKSIRAIILTAIALLALSTNLQAQTWHFGPKAGYAASWMPGTTINGDEQSILPHSSFYGGFLIDCYFGEMFYAEADIMYAGKGHSDKGGIDVRYSRQLNYLQMPLLFGVSFADDQATVAIGPEFGWLMSSTVKRMELPKYKDTESCNRFNIALGLQLEYMISDELGVDLKFDWGLNRTMKHYFDANDKGRNLSLQVGVCYKFEL